VIKLKIFKTDRTSAGNQKEKLKEHDQSGRTSIGVLKPEIQYFLYNIVVAKTNRDDNRNIFLENLV